MGGRDKQQDHAPGSARLQHMRVTARLALLNMLTAHGRSFGS